jgi:hypothetical protein
MTTLFPPKFALGEVYVSQGVMALEVDLDPYLRRHVCGNWGEELCFEDQQLNDAALMNGERILSKYQVRAGIFIYIITEHDRSLTTILLPIEY